MLYPYDSPDRLKFKKVSRKSLYITMRDGIELAIDVWLPGPVTANQKFPTLLHQTRYWRAPELRWPFSVFSDGLLGHEGAMVKELILNGYAFVNVDCRGSGASFGTHPHPWSADEVKDGFEVAEWIVHQSWSNGILGAVGISYTGTTAEFAMGNQHPAIKAVMPLFSLYDVFEDIAFPGGIPHDGFVIEWGKANASLDQNILPIKNPIVHLLVKGVLPVGKGKAAKAKFEEAIASHEGNLGVHETSAGIEFRDQSPKNRLVLSMDAFSPHSHQKKADLSGSALLSVSGWRDGAYPHASIRRYLNSATPTNRLVLGPWDHGGKNHITPGKERKLKAEMASEAVKFFDQFLKGYATAIDKQPAVQYYTMQEEKWKGSDSWPPSGFQPTPFYLSPEYVLQSEKPSTSGKSLTLTHDTRQGTGHYTRWRGLRMTLGSGRLYPDRKKRDQLLKCWDSPILKTDIEVTGHGEARLFLRTQEPDGNFFVYLEDITPGGEVWYVTEGLFRAIHRKIPNTPPPYRDPVTYHSYLLDDALPIPAGQIIEITFDLLPVSYLFKQGHRIRIGIATGDCDNFRQISRAGSKYELMVGGEWASQIILPVGL